MSSDDDMYVIKRNGQKEVVSFDKILKRIKKVGAEADVKINYTTLAMKVIDQLFSGISTTKIDELTSEQCASLSSTNQDYNTLAGRIIVSNNHKNTKPSFYQVVKELYNFKDIHGKSYPLVSELFYKTVCSYGKEKIDSICDYSRDYLIDYFGFKTLERAYLMRINKKIIERPQHMWLRVSIGIHNDDWESVIETYNYMSQKYFTHATPTLFNAGTPKPQLSSCYLMAMEDDSIDGIFNTLKDCALISKWAGGIGLHIHNVRASGTHIRGTNGTSNGIVPMLKVFNNTAKYVDQGGGKRNGSFAIYLEPWHSDIEIFLEMRKNHGDEEQKARDLFYALWTPDLFMKRVKSNGTWTLMCPAECPGLSDVYGDDFETLYVQYEKENRGKKVINARELWFQILDSQMETGTPYLLYKDASNKKSNQKNLGTIKSSNLCVSPGTLILTDKGQFPIYSLWSGNYPTDQQLENKYCNVWNGTNFSKVEIFKTGENVKFLNIYTSDGCILTCTPYHKFYIRDGAHGIIVKEAKDLLRGDLLESNEFPVVDFKNDFDSVYEDPFESGCQTGMKHLQSKNENENLDVPINGDLYEKMGWFSGFFEPYITLYNAFGNIEVNSINKNFLMDIKYMLQTCSINVIVENRLVENDENWILIISQIQVTKLYKLGLKFKSFVDSKNYDFINSFDNPNVRIIKIEESELVDDSYCFTEQDKHAGIFNGIRTGQCTEIIEYSDKDETAVCNLASIALPTFVKTNENDKYFDYEELHKVTKIVTNNLNKVIDINYYPTPKTKNSNMKHRPIGIGVQGLADVFFMLGLAFSSEKSKEINKNIFETIYHASLEMSWENACKYGAYETFKGSPASNGILQFDMWDVKQSNDRYNWTELKEKIKKDGIRNSLLLAPMPTASTSQILGYNECIEPITSNIYSRRTIAGEFILANKYLMKELSDKKLWNEEVKNHIIANNGSIQNLEYIDQNVRDKYKTVWELRMKDLIDMACDRGVYICQSQSLNLWLEDPNYNTMTAMHFYSWEKGLKTGIYYLRRRPKHQAQQFTIEPEKQNHEICEMCSS
jgi:ribonucleotide reductase alpha subunit